MQLAANFSEELNQLKEELDADFAIISHIEGEKYTVLDIASEFDVIQSGAEFVTRDTYCNAVVETSDVVFFHKVSSIHEMATHPVYTAMGLEAYLGIPLFNRDKVVGTLNFTYYSPHLHDFSDELIARARSLGRRIEQALV